MSVNISDLKKYARAGLNVILSGPHGVGKTAVIKEVFNGVFGEHYTNWRYFSASTLDPWVDFIGIPKNYTREDGKEVFGIIPPDHFTGEENIQAIFFDEINRAEEKTLNALMELIQFRSINGRKFPNLKCVWAAENPSDDEENEYMVKKLDPAQRDRFQIQMFLENELAYPYMKSKYGNDITEISSKWWKDFKKDVSPRKLDDMLSGFMQGFNLTHYVPKNVNARSLQKSLEAINEIEVIKSIIASGAEATKKYFTLNKITEIGPIFDLYPELAINIAPDVSGEIKEKLKEFVNAKTSIKIDEEVKKRKLGQKKVSKIEEDVAVEADEIIFTDPKSVEFTKIGISNFEDEFYARIVNFNANVDFEDCQDKKMSNWKIALPPRASTYQFRKFVNFASSKNHEDAFKEFFKKLATLVVYTKNRNAEAVFRKLQGCNAIAQKFNINNSIAKEVLAYANGKVNTVPKIENLTEGNRKKWF